MMHDVTSFRLQLVYLLIRPYTAQDGRRYQLYRVPDSLSTCRNQAPTDRLEQTFLHVGHAKDAVE